MVVSLRRFRWKVRKVKVIVFNFVVNLLVIRLNVIEANVNLIKTFFKFILLKVWWLEHRTYLCSRFRRDVEIMREIAVLESTTRRE